MSIIQAPFNCPQTKLPLTIFFVYNLNARSFSLTNLFGCLILSVIESRWNRNFQIGLAQSDREIFKLCIYRQTTKPCKACTT